jgi:anti-sigma factor RsiW
MSLPDDDTLARLMALLDGELDEEEREALEARLAEDAQLGQWLSEAREALALMEAAPPPEAPADFEDQVRRRLRRRSRGRVFAPPAQTTGAWMFIVLSGLFLMLWWWLIRQPGLGTLWDAEEPAAEAPAPGDGPPAGQAPEPTPDARPEDGSPEARRGSPPARPVSVMAPRMQAWAYVVHVDAGHDATSLDARLREWAGGRRVLRTRHGWLMHVRQPQAAAWAQRLAPLGEVERRHIEVRDSQADVPLEIRYAAEVHPRAEPVELNSPRAEGGQRDPDTE